MTACIVLASGFSKRFGSNKLMMTVHGKPMYRHILDTLDSLKSNNSEIDVVIVTQYCEIYDYAKRNGLSVLYNNQAKEGISASIRLGVSHSTSAEWLAFFVADQPMLKEETIADFLKSSISSGKTLACCCSGNIPGNPGLFHSKWKNDLMKLTGDTGGKTILKKHPEEVYFFEIPKEELYDIDCTCDL